MFDQREMELNSYLPDYLKGIREFNEITEVESKELTQLVTCTDMLWNNGFILSSDYQGIKKWESLLGIRANTGISLEERRNIVLANWNYQLPYTQRKLQEQLTSLLDDNYEFYVDSYKFKLKIVVKERSLIVVKSIRDMVDNIIPANLESIFYSNYQGEFYTNISSSNGIFVRTIFFPRYNLAHLYLEGNWSLNMDNKLNGYNAESPIDFYPAKARYCTEVHSQDISEGLLRMTTSFPKQSVLEAGEFGLQSELKNNSTIKEKASFNLSCKNKIMVGSVCISNRNVLGNEWILNGNRNLNGGSIIL